MTLPTTKQKPITDISRVTMVLYGTPKVGKSTFCSRFPNGFFIATEPGLNHLETFNLRADCWAGSLSILDDLEKEPQRFSPIIVDTVDKLWDFCTDHIAAKYHIETIGDLAYGKGYNLAEIEFKAFIQRLVNLNAGLVFISHHAFEELTASDGSAVKKFMPSIPDRARKIIMPLVDIIAFAAIEFSYDKQSGTRKENRVLHVQPGTLWEAGDRTHRLPDTLPFSFQCFKQFIEKEETKK